MQVKKVIGCAAVAVVTGAVVAGGLYLQQESDTGVLIDQSISEPVIESEEVIENESEVEPALVSGAYGCCPDNWD